jgi:hypothetical protein
MEAASTAIPPLGLVLDLILHKVLMRMCKRSTGRSGGAVTCLAGARGWMRVGAGARLSQDRYGGEKVMEVEVTAMGGRQKWNRVNPALGRPIYRGVHRSTHYGSFCRTTRLNGSIPRNSRED